MRIAVTGSSGKLGRETVERLRAEGHSVVGLDLVGTPGPGFTRVDFSDYGQVLDAFLGVTGRHEGFDALVHLAAIPVNGIVPDVTTFHNNLTASFNALHAAYRAGIRTIVSASSITVMGFPFERPPAYLPIDEQTLGSTNSYALAKVAEEAISSQLAGWNPASSITMLRFTNIVGRDEYASFGRADDPGYRRDLLWSYLDARDGALAVSLALAHAEPGFEIYDVAASDTGVTIPTAELVANTFPGVPVRKELGRFETLMSIEKARARLGFEPEHLWRAEFNG